MTDLPIWAQDKAREWREQNLAGGGWEWQLENLAALLVEVAAVGEMVRAEDAEYLSTLRADMLAEVRRVVVDVQKSIWGAPTDEGTAVTLCCDEILSRLEKLDIPRPEEKP